MVASAFGKVLTTTSAAARKISFSSDVVRDATTRSCILSFERRATINATNERFPRNYTARSFVFLITYASNEPRLRAAELFARAHRSTNIFRYLRGTSVDFAIPPVAQSKDTRRMF